ncbi:MAG: DUF222 domain-containing protein [Acidimicrobiales bacterium]
MQGLVRLREAIESLRADDVASLSDDDLVAAMPDLHQLDSMLVAQQARLVAEIDRRKLWRRDGSKALWAWLARRTGAAAGAAKALAGLTRRLRLAPVTRAAFEAGDIDRERAVELCKRAASPRTGTADAFSRHEHELVRRAASQRFEAFLGDLRYWEALVDQDEEERQAHDDVEARNLHASETLRGMVRIDGLLDPVQGAEFLEALTRITDELYRNDWESARAVHGDDTRNEHLARTPAQRRADALAEMARRAMTAPAHGKRPRPLVTVHVGTGTVERMCELASGAVIAPGLLVPHLGHADIERIIYGPGKRVIELSKRARFFRGGLRRAIELRDRWCFHPTCKVPAERCHIDHLDPVCHGGFTTQENGRSACDTHNWWTYNFEQRSGTQLLDPDRPVPPDTR